MTRSARALRLELKSMASAVKENSAANCAPTPVRAQLSESSAVAQIIERLEALSRIDERTAGMADTLRSLQTNAATNGEMLQTLCERSVEFEHSLEDIVRDARPIGRRHSRGPPAQA